MLGTRYRGRRIGVAVRAGSVEQARREARLTLAQVAGGKLTRTAIHLIEKGRTRPSMETLQQIARQTHKPIEFFLHPDAPAALTERQAQLRELERLTAVRELGAVVEMGQTLLDQRWSAEDAAIINFSVGQAYCRMVRPNEALEHLRLARAEFERLSDEWMAVEALDWESSALGLLDDPAALPLANETLERCRRLGPSAGQIEARILGHIAGMYVVSHSWTLAVRYYECALEAATGVKDLLQLAKMHHGLGGAFNQMGDPTTARQHFDRALALYSMENDLASICRVENDLGNLLLRQGHLDTAEQHLLTALKGSEEHNIDRRGRGHILVGLGEIELRRGHLSEATTRLNQACKAGTATGERIVQAEASVLLGRVAEQTGNTAVADTHFETAIQILEELRMPDRLRDVHMDYAEVLDARRDVTAASRHWKRAAEVSKLSSLGIRWTATPAAERIASAGPTGVA
ncbi:MAG TPA: helix-turn-helix transcriptional regulator [Candidatus Dormibacteraeota bacterium]|nr:helix-turn-helix transcriptional regulator [Candidatus Dormibacteraeota bacterium]